MTLLRKREGKYGDNLHVGAIVSVHWGQSEYAGRARVVGIAPCLPIAQGDGYVVTATIRRIAKSHLKIDFGEESIGVTEEHPFWSEDRNGWVSAKRLKVNEVVRSTGNKQVSVKSITRQKQASVYNLEVNRSHSYLVGKSRLVVHNGCGEQEEPKGPGFDQARRAAFGHAGLTDGTNVEFSKVDPATGTVTEFKGPDGAKVGFDSDHPNTPGPHHDQQHISAQKGGKRKAGAGDRKNFPYSGTQHPCRPKNK